MVKDPTIQGFTSLCSEITDRWSQFKRSDGKDLISKSLPMAWNAENATKATKSQQLAAKIRAGMTGATGIFLGGMTLVVAASPIGLIGTAVFGAIAANELRRSNKLRADIEKINEVFGVIKEDFDVFIKTAKSTAKALKEKGDLESLEKLKVEFLNFVDNNLDISEKRLKDGKTPLEEKGPINYTALRICSKTFAEIERSIASTSSSPQRGITSNNLERASAREISPTTQVNMNDNFGR